MKRFWNYIFYFTWKLHCVIGINIVEKPLKYILRVIPIFARNLKKGEKMHRSVLDNPEYGFNIGFAYRCMLSTTIIILASIEIWIFFSFNTGLSQILRLLFNVNLSMELNAIAFFSSIVIFSYILNEVLLRWHHDGYIKYFKEFSETTTNKSGYCYAVIFHLGSILFCLFSVLYFNV